MGFKVKKRISVPQFKFEVGVPLILRLEAAMYIGKDLKQSAEEKDKPKKQPPVLCSVTNMETGEVGEIIVNSMVKARLDEEYPNGAYIGKVFEIKKRGQRAGKNYVDFDITEVEETDDEAASTDAGKTDEAPPVAPKKGANSKR